MTQYVDFLFYDGAVGLDITGPLEVFNAASILLRERGLSDQAYQPRFWSQRKGLVRLNSGLCLQAEHALGEGLASDIFIVPGAPDTDSIVENTAFIEGIKAMTEQAKKVVSVCTGAFVLAACGLLDQRRATTHWSQTALLAKRYPRIEVAPNAIYVRDGHLSTSAGVTAGIDLALALVEEDYGADLAIEISRWLVVYLRRPGGQAQFSAPLELQKKAGERFSKLHFWLLENLERPVDVEEMAEQAVMSPRHFSRVFSKMTGMTPGKYVESMRLERARELLESGKPQINRVAQLSGFGREERMRRAFVRELGVTPGLYQNHFGR